MTLRYLLLMIVVGLGSSILSGHLHPYGNLWQTKQQSAEPLLQDGSMPADAQAVLVKKCADCHSEAARAPFYASLAPGSWLIERDIVKARARMNLSRWQELSPERREVLGEEIVEQAKKGRMPPVQYRLRHCRQASRVRRLLRRCKQAMQREGSWSSSVDAQAVMQWMLIVKDRDCGMS